VRGLTPKVRLRKKSKDNLPKPYKDDIVSMTIGAMPSSKYSFNKTPKR